MIHAILVDPVRTYRNASPSERAALAAHMCSEAFAWLEFCAWDVHRQYAPFISVIGAA